jgi:hypothetical protein
MPVISGSLEETAAWKGSGERYYCNDFCAEAEAVQSPSLIPSLMVSM